MMNRLLGLLCLLPLAFAQLQPLKSYFTGGRYLGFFTNQGRMTSAGSTYVSIGETNFNAVTESNACKWEVIEPTQGQFAWSGCDYSFNWITSRGGKFRGHTLVWHSQLAPWVSTLSGSAVESAMSNHINTVMGHYKGKVYCWDVVNEALNEDGTLRTSVFYTQVGTDYITKAFQYARIADPAAKLYYNDYNIEAAGRKQDGAFNLVRDLKAKGLIDGIGLQGHFTVGQMPANLTGTVQRFASLGIDVAFTEVDIGTTTQDFVGQARDYATMTTACVSVDRCVGITIGGIRDNESPYWRFGQYTLLWDESYQPKPAASAVASVAAGGTGGSPGTSAPTPSSTPVSSSTPTSTSSAPAATQTKYGQCGEAPPPQVNDPESQDEEAEDDDTQYKPKPAKRRKVVPGDGETKRVVPRGKGKLRNLPQMPLDILFEIFGFLTPLDVLRLARTTKDFRSVLMKRSAISLWKTVFDNVPGTPEKPEDICEPAWANFLFTNHCYQCFSPRPSHTFGGHYVRFCKRCATDKEFDVRTSEVSQKLLRLGISPYDSPCRVYSIAYEYEGTYAWSSKHYSSRSRLSYLRVDLDDFLEGYERVRQNEEERKAFLEQRKERFRLIDQRIPVYKKWFTEKHDERSAERDDIRAARFEAIQQKLSDLGWASELKTLGPSDMDTLRQLPNVKVPRPLTNRMWNKIEPEIVPLMEGFRDERLKKERAAVLKRRRQIFADVVKDYNSSQPPDSILPCPSDLYFLESFAPVKTSIEEDPNEVKYSASNFDDVIAEMPRYCEEWKALCASQLIEFANNDASVKNADPPITFDESTLQLARTATDVFIANHACTIPGLPKQCLISSVTTGPNQLVPCYG
ncbi:hypothetical protein ONZ45_g18442 [Pleurotus djamor]|nr:hypothetical protein ONZ45_g18442 [Pleurotus djamor]